jgi:hypothetical protein
LSACHAEAFGVGGLGVLRFQMAINGVFPTYPSMPEYFAVMQSEYCSVIVLAVVLVSSRNC